MNKRKMATTKKRSGESGKFVEFFSAIFGFWPVWLSALFILIIISGYEYYSNLESIIAPEKKISNNQQLSIDREKIKVNGKLHYLDEEIIREIVSEKLQQGYLASDLIKIREDIEVQPWVKSATIKRLPPDLLEVNIIEQIPMLRWQDKALISQWGDLFFPEDMSPFQMLPSIHSEKKSIKTALDFLSKSVSILKEINQQLKSVNEDELGSWKIKTVQGVDLKFGRKQFSHRLHILKKLWPAAIRKGSVKEIDLRYGNGAAVSYLAAL